MVPFICGLNHGMIGIESFEGIQPALNLGERSYLPLLWDELGPLVEPETFSGISTLLIFAKGNFRLPLVPGGKKCVGNVSKSCGVVEVILNIGVGLPSLVEMCLVILIH